MLKTLDQHNTDRWESHMQIGSINNPRKNGIACPECGEELWDTNPMITLTSNPPKKNIHCNNCDYFGYRLA